MTKVYACLLGNWACLNDDPNCVIGEKLQDPTLWWKEGAELYSPFKKEKENTYYGLDQVKIHYNGKDYHISPILIQVVTEHIS